MVRAGVIALIIIFLQITTFACDWKDLSPSFMKELNTQSTVFHMCQTVQDNTNDKIATIACLNDRNYMVLYSGNSIYMQTSSNIRNHVLTKCYREGVIRNSCEVSLAPIKCQAWDLDTY